MQAKTTLIQLEKPDFYTLLTSAMLELQQGNSSICSTLLRELNHGDRWYIKRYGLVWCMKKNLLELLGLIDNNAPDLAEQKIKLLKTQSKELQGNVMHGLQDYLKIIQLALNSPLGWGDEKVISRAERLPQLQLNDDILAISLYGWLLARLNGGRTYEHILELLGDKN